MMNIKYLEHCIDCSKHLTDVRYKNQEKENSSTAKIDLKKCRRQNSKNMFRAAFSKTCSTEHFRVNCYVHRCY